MVKVKQNQWVFRGPITLTYTFEPDLAEKLLERWNMSRDHRLMATFKTPQKIEIEDSEAYIIKRRNSPIQFYARKFGQSGYVAFRVSRFEEEFQAKLDGLYVPLQQRFKPVQLYREDD